MASLLTHAFVGAALGQAADRQWRSDWRFWAIVVACSVVQDIDSIGFHMGIPYGALWGHRGMTHSLLFAFIVSTFVAAVLDGRFHSQWKLAILFFLIMSSHGVLDAMTDGGLGVAFFSPFNSQRYFLPWTPIHVSPIGVGRFFTARGLHILTNEILWIWCPTLLLLALTKAIQIFRHSRRKPNDASSPAGEGLS